jgi:hypothetical protein
MLQRRLFFLTILFGSVAIDVGIISHRYSRESLGVSTIVTYGCAAVVTRTFLSAQTILGPSKVFAIYCVITIFGLFFEYLSIPDTGEKTVDQIDEALSGMYWWRFDAIALSQIDQDAAPATAPDVHHRSSSSQIIEMNPSPSLDSPPSLT